MTIDAMDVLDGEYDLLVIGGGINGVGVARDAAGRGIRVALCERGDLGGATSMASSKLIHGGLRYLEQRQWRLVRESLAERELLMRLAPHLVRPLRFVLPHAPGLRPKWMIRAGLWLYDCLGGASTLPRSRVVDLHRPPFDDDLDPRFGSGFSYSDCRVDDARLVVVNALSAQTLGANILPRTACVGLTALENGWRADLEAADGRRGSMSAKAVVNAAGPWVEQLLREIAGMRVEARVRLVKGSHIVVPRRIAGDHAYILQNHDGRIVFLLPFERKFTLIGTTEVVLAQPPTAMEASDDEVQYLCEAANRYVRKQVHADDVVWRYAGVRALHDDGKASPTEVTRDYVLHLDHVGGGAPILSVFGGKITTYRRLAEHALEKLSPVLAFPGRPWTATAPLPGAASGHLDYVAFL
ncbi:MAG TPA: glycerol-3-phosphate dehydrogenase, partial [Burkholderiales bacterium]|nr:glycerol-3-phosphate dehydrogenase [Burkholderiales bacterium]